MFEPIKVTLEEIKSNAEGHWNHNSISIAADLLFAFHFKFIIFLVITRNILKGQLHSKNKLSSNERVRKMQKHELSLTSMRQMVLEISHSKVRNLNKMEVAILKVFSLILTQI